MHNLSVCPSETASFAVTQISLLTTAEAVHLPEGLQNLTFGSRFDQSLDDVKLPELLNELTFGHCFNQPMDKAKKIRELHESQKLGSKFRWLSQ